VPAVRTAFPDAWFLGEMIHGDYAAYAAEAALDSVTQYEVWKAVWSSLNERNFYELDHALGRHNAFLDGELAQTFVGNHDVTRLATALHDDRHFSHAIAILCCIGGVPTVYYGDEQGLRGLKEHRAGGDDAIRPAFPAAPPDLPPDGWRYYRLHQRLIGFRRRHRWLVRARTEAEQLQPAALALRLRGEAPGEHALLLLNAGDEDFRFTVDPAGLTVAETTEPGAVPADPLLVPAHGWTILA
jgi:glycosidase